MSTTAEYTPIGPKQNKFGTKIGPLQNKFGTKTIQSTFQKCLTQANGLFGIIDSESDEYRILGDINRIVTLELDEYYIEEEDSLLIDIDRWTEALLKKNPPLSLGEHATWAITKVRPLHDHGIIKAQYEHQNLAY